MCVTDDFHSFWAVVPSLISRDSGFQALESQKLLPFLVTSRAERGLGHRREKSLSNSCHGNTISKGEEIFLNMLIPISVFLRSVSAREAM